MPSSPRAPVPVDLYAYVDEVLRYLKINTGRTKGSTRARKIRLIEERLPQLSNEKIEDVAGKIAAVIRRSDPNINYKEAKAALSDQIRARSALRLLRTISS